MTAIPTGIPKLDEFLSGGIKNGLITDIFGANGTGKTQLAMQISLNFLNDNNDDTFLQEKQKPQKNVYFQDTTGEFRPERMLEIIKMRKWDPSLLDRIKVGRITNTSEQIQNLLTIRNHRKDFGLVIIDNVTDLFSFEYYKEEKSLQRNIAFMKYMRELSSIAIEQKIPIIVTNMIRSAGDFEIENLDKPISMFTHTKIRLARSGGQFTGQVITSLQKQEFSYLITTQGLLEQA